MSTAENESTLQRRWRWTSKNISFGEKQLSFSGAAPDWSKLGVLVPMVVLANLIIRTWPALPVTGLISVYGICVAGSHVLVRVVRKRPQFVKAGLAAVLAAGAGIASLNFGPMLLTLSERNQSGGTYGAAALTLSLGLNLGREFLVLIFPIDKDSGGSENRRRGRRA
ncbi:hypothetical protein ACI2LF_26825 [Kribbella sp. NPDC020789]